MSDIDQEARAWAERQYDCEHKALHTAVINAFGAVHRAQEEKRMFELNAKSIIDYKIELYKATRP